MNRTIILRCHTEVAEERGRRGTEQQNRAKVHQKTRRSQRHWPPFALVFDGETRLDERQSLTFGFARLLQDDGTSLRRVQSRNNLLRS